MTKPFNSHKYIEKQFSEISERLNKFPNGKLYFEIGGKFLFDRHAASVLPGFDPESKIKIIQKVAKEFDIIFCINSQEIESGRVWEADKTYEQSLFSMIEELEKKDLPKPKIAINLYKDEPKTLEIIAKLEEQGYKTYKRHFINGYPENVKLINSPSGFGKDDYIKTDSNFVVVIGLGSNSGKMSTCLGQVYHDRQLGMDSGYAKYETFPIWNLPLDHPVNLAYEAATVDIGDNNVYDHFHQEAYGEKSVNYNRDVEAFPILKNLIAEVASPENYMHNYKSPTDMGISNAKVGIEDKVAVKQAAIAEIKARIERYTKEVNEGNGKPEWVERCEELLRKAEAK